MTNILGGKELFTLSLETNGTRYELTSEQLAMILDTSNLYYEKYLVCSIQTADGNKWVPSTSSSYFPFYLELWVDSTGTGCTPLKLSDSSGRYTGYNIVDNEDYSTCTGAKFRCSSISSFPVTVTFYKPAKQETFQLLKGQGMRLVGDKASNVTAISYNGLGGNFYAPESPITAESYASLIENAETVTNKTITMSYDSAIGLADYGDFDTTNQTISAPLVVAGNKGFTVKTKAAEDLGDIYQLSYTNDGVTTISQSSTQLYIMFGVSSTINGVYKDGFFEVGKTYRLKGNFNLSIARDVIVGDAGNTVSLVAGDNSVDVTFTATTTKLEFYSLFTALTITNCTITKEVELTLLDKLTFDGSHWIKTDLKANETSQIECIFKLTNATKTGFLWCDREAVGGGNSFLITEGKYRCDYGSTGTNYGSADATKFHIASSDGGTFLLDGVQKRSSTITSFNTYGLFIGCSQEKGTVTYPKDNCLKGYVYRFTFNGEVLIPANNGTSDGLVNLETLVFYPLVNE